jgi:hypothetical protein
MNEAEYEALLAARWRRPLTEAEEARLRAHLARHPELRSQWDEEERELDRCLRTLPDAPISSNFTAQVLQKVAMDQARADRHRAARSLWREWVGALRWKGAAAAVMLAVCALVWRPWAPAPPSGAVTTAGDASTLEHLATLPPAEALQDFEAIQQLSNMPARDTVDLELLAALQ